MENRSLPATQQRRKRLRAEGDVARSHELSSALTFLALIALAAASANGLIQWFENFSSSVWQAETRELADVQVLQRFAFSILLKIAVVFGTAAGVTFMVVLGLNYLQSGRWTLKSRTPRGINFDAIASLFSFNSFFTALTSLTKIAILALSIWLAAKPDLNSVFSDSAFWQMSIRECLDTLTTLVFKCCFVAAIVLLVFSGVDYLRQWLRYERRIQMTSEELRDEIREIETDPQLSARRQEFYSNSRMYEDLDPNQQA